VLVCPVCGSTDVEIMSNDDFTAYICLSCGAEWSDRDTEEEFSEEEGAM